MRFSGSSPRVWGAKATIMVASAPQKPSPRFILSAAEGLSDSLACRAVKRLGFYCMVHSPLYPERAKRVERVWVNAPVPPAPRRQPARTAWPAVRVEFTRRAQLGEGVGEL